MTSERAVEPGETLREALRRLVSAIDLMNRDRGGSSETLNAEFLDALEQGRAALSGDGSLCRYCGSLGDCGQCEPEDMDARSGRLLRAALATAVLAVSSTPCSESHERDLAYAFGPVGTFAADLAAALRAVPA